MKTAFTPPCRLSCLGLLLLISNPGWAKAPEKIEIEYEIRKSGFKVAEMQETFSRDRFYYQLTSHSRPVGLLSAFLKGEIHVNSHGMIDDLTGLRPVSFNYERTERPEKNGQAEMNWSRQSLTINHAGKQQSLTLPAGTQDRLSAMYQFMFLSLADKEHLDFHMTNGRKLDDYRYGIIPNQQIKLGKQQQKATYLYYQNEQGQTRTEIWLCHDYLNLPCKMVVTDDDGDQLTQLMTRIKISNQPTE